MKGEINLLPHAIVLNRERRACLLGLGRLLQRLSFLLTLLITAEVMVYLAFAHIDQQLTQANGAQQSNPTVTQEINSTNQLLATIGQTKEQYTSWSLFITEVLNNTPVGVTIKKIDVKAGQNIMTIEGFSASHNSVLDFQHVLEQLSWVIEVKAPLQNFALGTNTGFTFNLVVPAKNHAQTNAQ